MTISGFDHAAIPIDSVDAMLHFYASLGFEVRRNPPFFSVHVGDSKINFHGPEVWHSSTFTLKGSTVARVSHEYGELLGERSRCD